MRIRHAAYIILTASFVIAGCAENHDEWVDEDAQLTIAVSSQWQNGRDNNTRTLPDFLTEESLTTPAPEWVFFALPFSLGNEHFYVKNPSTIPDIDNFIHYQDFYSMTGTKLDKNPITRNLAQIGDITAYYKVTNGVADDPVNFTPFRKIPDLGNCDYISSDPTRYPVDDSHPDHLLFKLYHRTALLRLKFAVDPNYLKLRDIVLRNIQINGYNVDFLDYSVLDETNGSQLSATASFIAFAYINPEVSAFLLRNSWTFECTYDIYEKDGISSAHLVRKEVTATNKVNLKALMNLSADELNAGYYYDLTITINPDYLYVLSEHDNKQHLNIQ